jgi:hypothetical protein
MGKLSSTGFLRAINGKRSLNFSYLNQSKSINQAMSVGALLADTVLYLLRKSKSD